MASSFVTASRRQTRQMLGLYKCWISSEFKFKREGRVSHYATNWPRPNYTNNDALNSIILQIYLGSLFKYSSKKQEEEKRLLEVEVCSRMSRS